MANDFPADGSERWNAAQGISTAFIKSAETVRAKWRVFNLAFDQESRSLC
jgi:hypothetical protein